MKIKKTTFAILFICLLTGLSLVILGGRLSRRRERGSRGKRDSGSRYDRSRDQGRRGKLRGVIAGTAVAGAAVSAKKDKTKKRAKSSAKKK